MKKFTKICLIIVAVMGGVGLVLCGIALVMGADPGTLRRMAQGGELRRGNWHIGPYGVYYKGEPEPRGEIDTGDRTEDSTYTYPVESIKNLELDVEAATLLFREGADDANVAVHLYDGSETYFEGEMDGDTLSLSYDTNYYGLGYPNAEIVVELPAGMSFEKIDMDIGAAEVEFALSDLICGNLLLDVGAGNITAGKITVTGEMDVDIGAGNVVIADGICQDIRLDCGVGRFTMQGVANGNVVARCGIGELKLDLEGDVSAYNYQLSCGMGNLEVNGTSYSLLGGSREITNPGAAKTIELDCGMGSIEFDLS